MLPARWANDEGAFAVDALAGISRGLRRAPRARALDAAPATASEPEACAEDVACARRVGERLGAVKAIAVRLAGLGDTVLVRVTVVDVARGSQELTRQEVIPRADGARVGDALARIASEVAAPWAPPPPAEEGGGATPWVLGALGAAIVAGAATAIGVAAQSDDPTTPSPPDRPDVVITPP